MTHSRKTIQDVYISVCRSSGFRLDHIRAAILTGMTLNISPLQVWMAMGDFDKMERVANGTHPVAKRKV